MLKLEKEKYCEDCTHYENEVIERPTKFYDTGGELVETYGDTVIGCKHRYICRRVYRFANKEAQK